jgi:tRNA pseudouridine55 synthase
VAALRRTRSGPFSLADAHPLQDVLDALAQGDLGALPAVSLPAALAHLDQIVLSEAAAHDLRLGRKLAWEVVAAGGSARRLCLLDPAGALVAVAEPRLDGTARTLRVFGRGLGRGLGRSSAVLH